MRSARIPALILLVAAIVGAFVVEQRDDDAPSSASAEDTTALPVEPGVVSPAASPADALASTWYCAGGTSDRNGVADHSIVIQNARPASVDATVTVIGGAILPPPAEPPDDGGATTTTQAPQSTTTTEPPPPLPTVAPVVRELEVPGRSVEVLRLGDEIDAEVAGAVVEVEGGDVTVEHVVEGELGSSAAPCSTIVSDSWAFPWGVTSRGNRELLVFLNPFPDDATLDVEFATDEGTRAPSVFDSFVVPARSVRAAWVDESTRRNQISAQVTLRSGRVAVDRIQVLTGEDEDDPRQGLSLASGQPVPSNVWVFPSGQTTRAISEQVVVYNPTDDSAEVEVEVRLDDPRRNGIPEPFALRVAPRRFEIVAVHEEQRVPAGVAHTSIVRSLNGVPITAERVQWALEPADTLGLSAMPGSPVEAPIWYLAAGGPTDEVDEWITLVNLSNDEDVTASITGLVGGQEVANVDLDDLQVPAAGRLDVRLGDHVDRASFPLVVEADGPVIIERGLYAVDGFGVSNSIGIPQEAGAEVLEPLAGR